MLSYNLFLHNLSGFCRFLIFSVETGFSGLFRSWSGLFGFWELLGPVPVSVFVPGGLRPKPDRTFKH